MTDSDTDIATSAINRLGIDLLISAAKAGQNFLLSPYSIQCALAMAFAGADGETREEMRSILHFPADDGALQLSFSTLARALDSAATRSSQEAGMMARMRGDSPLQLRVANRLFGQRGYNFRSEFLAALASGYGAPLEELDFAASPDDARVRINRWVEKQTQKKIKDLIPQGGVTRLTRLVLTNAIYFKAPWMAKFERSATTPRPFQIAGVGTENVPTMRRQDSYAYGAHEEFVAVAVPYVTGELQFLILLPDAPDGLANLKKKLTPDLFAECAKMRARDAILYLPKLTLRPSTMSLAENLQSLGLKTAFDHPEGSANFSRMAPREPEEYLCISEIFHQAFLALDEDGTEAAAATAVVIGGRGISRPTTPIEIMVDRPFVFAIQHRPSGACLFLGQVVDPR
jgi:serpin B